MLRCLAAGKENGSCVHVEEGGDHRIEAAKPIINRGRVLRHSPAPPDCEWMKPRAGLASADRRRHAIDGALENQSLLEERMAIVALLHSRSRRLLRLFGFQRVDLDQRIRHAVPGRRPYARVSVRTARHPMSNLPPTA